MSEDDDPRPPDGSEPANIDRSDDDSTPVDDRPSDALTSTGTGGPADITSTETETETDGFADGRSEHDGTGPMGRVLAANSGVLLVLRETAVSVGAVVAVGLLLFAISGVWPPMVAVESGSMEPHMQKGDLVFMTEPGRFAGEAARAGTGVVTRETGREGDHWKFGAAGSVIVYDDPGSGGPPVIHRAQFWVEEGENWYDRANPDYVAADDCAEMRNCPAPNNGFVTKGDANGRYDQVNGISQPVKPGWIVGIARVRIPYLGWVRLSVSSLVLDTVPEPVTNPVVGDLAVDGAEPHPGGDAWTERATRARTPTAPTTRSPDPRVTAATAGTSSHATQ